MEVKTSSCCKREMLADAEKGNKKQPPYYISLFYPPNSSDQCLK